MRAQSLFLPLFHVLIVNLLIKSSVADDSNSSPTAWLWRTGTPSYISSQVALGYRIVDLEVYSTSPFRLTALMVHNSGSYAQTWWWYYNIDAATLSSKLSEHSARIVDIEAYYLGSNLRFSVVLTPNTGSNRKAWWYYYGVTPSFISTKLTENSARLVDIDAYKQGSSTRYAVVMIRNSGSDARAWWWYYGVSASYISGRLSANRARLMDIEYLGSGRYAVIMERSSARWYWYYGITSSSTMLSYAAQNGARLFHVIPYRDSSNRLRWAGIMIANLNEVGENTIRYMQPRRSGGSFGFFMREIGGSVKASLLSTRVFEPASSIKALHYAHAMRKVQLGEDSIHSSVKVYTDTTGSCPRGVGPFSTYRLKQSLRRMMRSSSNPDTLAMVTRYSEDEINSSGRALGMSSSRIQHRIGCGSSSGSIVGQRDAPNRLTLEDISMLYGRVATTWLSGNTRRRFFKWMLSYHTVYTVVDEEAAKLPSLSSSTVQNFKDLMDVRQKGGSYVIGTFRYRSIGGYAKLPFRSCSGRISYREYSMGAFIDQAKSLSANGVVGRAGAETMRGVIAEALKTFQLCFARSTK